MAMIVDADTHVIESPGMWDLLGETVYPKRPLLVTIPGDTVYRTRNAFWLIDGNMFPKGAGKGGFSLSTPSAQLRQTSRTDISIGCREATDTDARLADMDRLGVDVQVLYPTLFLIYVTDDLQLEIALCDAYNRWMAGMWSRAGNRLRWTAVLPLRSIDASLEQIKQAKEHGAGGVLFRGIERDRMLDDPYFFPVYDAAAQLDLPICIHLGAGCPAWSNLFDLDRHSGFAANSMLPVIAFHDLVRNRIPEQFPALRFGFIEAGASWAPFLLHRLKRTLGVDGRTWGPRLFQDYRLYVACEADEDLPYLLQHIGEDNLLIGSDYGHADPSVEAELVATMRSRSDVSATAVDKILGLNAKRFYSL